MSEASGSIEKPNPIRETIIYIVMVTVAVTTVGPFLIMLSVSFTEISALSSFPSN